MKKILLLFLIQFAVGFSISNVNAQCIPDGSITTPGVIAFPSTVDCISRGVPFSDEIQFMNFDTIFFNNTWLTLQQLRIDSVNNLPCGINYQLNNTNGIYQNSEPGCISLSGTSYDTIGQYKLDVWASIDVGSGFFGPLQANNFDLLTFYTRVKYPASSCPFIDTLALNTLSACNSAYGLQLTLTATNELLCWNLQETAILSANVGNGSGHYSYQWNYADSLSCGDCPSPIFDSQIFQTGIFPVSVTVYDSVSTLSETQTINIDVNICGGINEHGVNYSLVIYPNPGKGVYTVELKDKPGSDYKLSLKSISGDEIKFKISELSTGKILLDIIDAAPGIYFLSAETEENLFVSKIVKQ